jgi:amino acid permease
MGQGRHRTTSSTHLAGRKNPAGMVPGPTVGWTPVPIGGGYIGNGNGGCDLRKGHHRQPQTHPKGHRRNGANTSPCSNYQSASLAHSSELITHAEPTAGPGLCKEISPHLSRQLTLRDLALSQILCVVGSAWVGIAAGLGHAQGVVWLIAFGTFYLPMATAVFYLNRALPLEGGLYAWARSAFGDTAGFLVAWNMWGYGLTTIATVLFQIPSEFAFMVGPDAAWIPESHGVVLSFLAVVLLLLALSAVRGLALGKWIHNVSSAAMMATYSSPAEANSVWPIRATEVGVGSGSFESNGAK